MSHFGSNHFAANHFACNHFRPTGEIVIPVPEPQPEIPGTGGGGRYDPGYTRQREDALEETRRKRILQEDEEVAALIMAMVTEGLI